MRIELFLSPLPWPLGNRWYIIKVLRDESQAAKHRYTASWSQVMGNLRENRGEWRLEPFGEKKTLSPGMVAV